jgi:hypothetical protein
MGKVAILKIEGDGVVSGTVTEFNNDAEARASITESGSYVFADVQEIEVEGSNSASATKATTKKAATKKGK